MSKIISKPYLNKNNKQMTIVVQKKNLPIKLRYCKDLMFELKAFRGKK